MQSEEEENLVMLSDIIASDETVVNPESKQLNKVRQLTLEIEKIYHDYEMENSRINLRLKRVRRFEKIIDSIRGRTICSVCRENMEFSTFISIVCGHTLCLVCYNKMKINSSETFVKCPECRELIF